MNIIPIPGSAGAAVVVTSVTSQDVADWLVPEERQALDSFRRDQRRDEWAASRIAARIIAVRRGLVERPDGITFSREGEKPFAYTAGGDRLFVSFSHTLSRGAAALDTSPIGIDIERVRQIESRGWKFFLSDDEIGDVESMITGLAPLHWWCAKEAAFKLTSASSLKAVQLRREFDGNEEARFAGAGFTVTSLAMGEIVAAIARSSSQGDERASLPGS